MPTHRPRDATPQSAGKHKPVKTTTYSGPGSEARSSSVGALWPIAQCGNQVGEPVGRPANCAESITAADIMFMLELVSVAVRKCGRNDAVPFLEGGPMTTSKMPWLMAGFVCLSLFSACGPEKPTAPSVTGDVASGAAGEPHRELVPGLDIWSRERRPAPQWGSKKEITADYLSRAERHREFMQGGVPLEYRSRRSPYPAATNIILDGGRLYKSHCAACHGSGGLGEGEASRDLTPPPAFLAYLINRPRSVDEYLLWTISEGGVQFGTEMPAYKEVLTERQIWQIVTYMRAGFPNVEKAG